MDRHLTHDELVLHDYGEMTDALEARTVAHLDACGACREDLARLQRSLGLVDADPAPQPRAGFESRLWARLEPELRTTVAQPARYAVWRLGWIAAAAVLVVAAFVAGRMSADPTPLSAPAATTASAVAPAPVADRMLTVDLSDHLGRAELALTEFLAANGDASSVPATEDLIAANRLYRSTAIALGNANVADVLDELERALIEISAAPDAPEAERQAVREWIDSRDLLFKVRVMREAQGAAL